MRSTVSVIIPCYNERDTIGLLLEAIDRQTYPRDRMEVIIADGMSTDGTREVIEEFARNHPQMPTRVVDNPRRNIPAGLNLAIKDSGGEVIVRLDAHSIPERDYIERCLEILTGQGAANVGGMWVIRPSGETMMAKAIARAVSHPLGAGDARYRTSGAAGEVETVPFGAFSRKWVEKVGLFNESLLSNEDYEYNVRLRRAGGRIWFDPRIRSIYFAREHLAPLARQYARYGFWKARMLLQHPASMRWRQLLPATFVLSILVLAAWGFLLRTMWLLLGVQLGLYIMICAAAGIIEARRAKDMGVALGFPLALWTEHFAWGAAFLWGLLSGFFERRDRGRGK